MTKRSFESAVGSSSAKAAFTELYPEWLFQTWELPKTRDRLAAAVFPLLNDANALGFPAIFGIDHTTAVLEDPRKKIGIPVFEIPALSPAIAG